MKSTFNKTSPDANAIYARLKEIRLSSRERVLAEANLARAEVLADLLADGYKAAKAFVGKLVVQPIKRFTASIG
ncbi:MAG: hypothetical protein ACREU7_05465 [Burkholderiales bacterium]